MIGAALRMRRYFLIWLSTEVIVFTIIGLIRKWDKRPRLNTESVIVYFIYQAIARIRILVGIIQWIENFPPMLLVIGVIVKLGVVPFHVWVLPVIKGCNLSAFFTLLVPVKLPIYLIREPWVGDFLLPILVRVIVGVLLSINQRSLIRLIAASRISSTGLLLMCEKIGVFSSYFVGYSSSLCCVLLGVAYLDCRVTSVGIISLLGLPLLPIFFPKLWLLLGRLRYTPFIRIIILARFMFSSLYYVKFLPVGLIKERRLGAQALLVIVLISLTSAV